MTSSIPEIIAWPFLILMTVVTLARLVVVHVDRVDRLSNQGLVFGLIGLLLREKAVEDLLGRYLGPLGEINLLRQLSFGFIVMTCAAIYGQVLLWAGRDPKDAAHRQRRYYLVGVALSAIIMIAGTRARNRRLLIDQALGWDTVVAWLAFYAIIAAVVIALVPVCIRELRVGGVTGRERLVIYATLLLCTLLGIDSIATPLLTIAEVVSGKPSTDPEMHTKALTFFVAAVGATILAAVPLAGALLARFGWDRTARQCRHLHPLWADLTHAFPAIVFSDAEHSPRQQWSSARLHRMTVEIRDALLRLKNYSISVDAKTAAQVKNRYRRTGSRHQTLLVAVQAARAYDAKMAGTEPSRDLTVDIVPMPSDVHTGGLPAETTQLLDLAHVWPLAREFVNAENASQLSPEH